MLFSLDDIKFSAAFWKKAEKSWAQQLLELFNISKKVAVPVGNMFSRDHIPGLQCHRLHCNVFP